MADASDELFSHAVYFTLKEATPTGREALVAACKKYLANHSGCVHFSVSARAEQYQRPVNDQEFDVALVTIFESAATHDEYQVSQRHQQFLAEQKDAWAKVRVFDAGG